MTNRHAFTMIELVFVIVVLGILSAIAIPRIAATRDDAEVAKIRSDVSAIRSAIVSERQLRLLKGEVDYISRLDKGVSADTTDVALFDSNDSSGLYKLLQYPIYSSKESANRPTSGHWLKKDSDTYTVSVGGTLIDFDYDNNDGSFDCDHTETSCKSLTK